tara:strand:+ start:530 stop:781 length:252 start_codon:yes stop_codon:yes gene_type:complete
MSVKREAAKEVKNFFEGKPCSFPGWQQLQTNYDKAKNNLGAGCAPCKRNALKRKFAAKIGKLVELKFKRAAELRAEEAKKNQQ